MEARDEWLEKVWPNLREKYEPENVWNTDETGLQFRDEQKSLSVH